MLVKFHIRHPGDGGEAGGKDFLNADHRLARFLGQGQEIAQQVILFRVHRDAVLVQAGPLGRILHGVQQDAFLVGQAVFQGVDARPDASLRDGLDSVAVHPAAFGHHPDEIVVDMPEPMSLCSCVPTVKGWMCSFLFSASP